MLPISVNGHSFSVDADRETPLLWVLRDVLRFLDSRVTYGLLRLGPALVVASDCLVH